jgi:glycosyltransferase involved in cell wall biosynthesis
MEELISVIVPVYNLEESIQKCFDSIIMQTYEKFELILIDDGSTDKSGMICDEYAFRDNRVKVIHQKNQGTGHSRNVALGIAKGKYIAFVDCDDWIDSNMLSEMHSWLKNNDADIVVAGHHNVYLDNSIKTIITVDEPIFLNQIEATSLILEDKKIFSFPWDKLYKRELFEGISYPENLVFEDISTTFKLFYKADKVILLNKAYYYYYQRESSASLNQEFSHAIKRKIDHYFAFYERYQFVSTHSEFGHIFHECQKKAFKFGQYLVHFIIKMNLNKNSTRFYKTLTELSFMDINNNILLKKIEKAEHKIMRFSTGIYIFLLHTYYSLYRN